MVMMLVKVPFATTSSFSRSLPLSIPYPEYPMNKISFGALLIALSTFFLCSCNLPKTSEKAGKRPKGPVIVEGLIAQLADLNEVITIPGTLKPFEETVLRPEVSGRVVKCDIAEGKAVKKGTLLVKLSDADLQAELGKVEAQLKIAQVAEHRASELLKISGISQAEYDAVALNVNSISADIQILKVQIGKTEILAPFDGVVGLRNISVGAEVSSSTNLLTMRSIHQFKLDFSVPEKYSTYIKTGLPVTFNIQGKEKPFNASVMATEQGIEAATRTLKVRALCNASSTDFIPGTFVSVTLTLGENRRAILIPTQAIVPQENNKKVIVARHGKATMVPVITGVRRSSAIEIISGLSVGDTVVTTGILFIKPNMPLTFAKVAK